MNDEKTRMKYSCIERERRFLLAEMPDDLPPDYLVVTDWYIPQTRFRLRCFEAPDGRVVDLKFTQKFISPSSAIGHAIITNFYLTESEFRLLRTLGGQPVRKHRYRYPVCGDSGGVDVFQGELTGLVMAEVEFADDQALHDCQLPEFAVADVTSEPFFRGGHLCSVSSDNLRVELATWY